MDIISKQKAIYLLLILLAFSGESISQNIIDKPTIENEIKWHSNIIDALAQAKKENKLLFVECYSPTCPHCMELEPFFNLNEIALKYNSSFINYKLDITNLEETAFLNDRKIWLPSWPRFLFFNADGKLVHQSSVDPSVASINSTADIALNKDLRSSSYESRFQNGERSIKFLLNFADYGKVISNHNFTDQASSELYALYSKNDLDSKESWMITKKTVTDIDNGFAQFWVNNIKKAAEYENESGLPGAELNTFREIVQNTLLNPKAGEYSLQKISRIKEFMNKMNANEFIDSFTWEMESKALIKDGKSEQALLLLNKMVDKNKLNGPGIVYITSVASDNFSENHYISNAHKWLSQALLILGSNNSNQEYYYELSRVLKREGKVTEAKAYAIKAQKIAAAKEVKGSKFNELVNSFN